MTTSALVITLSDDREAAAELLSALRLDPRFEVGDRAASGSTRRVPVALQTEDEREARRCWSWLEAQPGAASLQLVSVLPGTAAVHAAAARQRAVG